MFKKIQNTLRDLVKTNTDKDYVEYQELQKKWQEKIEKKIKENVEIIDFTEGTMTLKTKNTIWKNELLFIQEEIKKNFQTRKTQ